MERLAGRHPTDLDFSVTAFSPTAGYISIGLPPPHDTVYPTSSIIAMAPFDDPACSASGNANPLTTLLKTTTADRSLQQDKLRPNGDNKPNETMRSAHAAHAEASMKLRVRNSLLVLTCESADNPSQKFSFRAQDDKTSTRDDSSFQKLVKMTLEHEQVRKFLLVFI